MVGKWWKWREVLERGHRDEHFGGLEFDVWPTLSPSARRSLHLRWDLLVRKWKRELFWSHVIFLIWMWHVFCSYLSLLWYHLGFRSPGPLSFTLHTPGSHTSLYPLSAGMSLWNMGHALLLFTPIPCPVHPLLWLIIFQAHFNFRMIVLIMLIRWWFLI